MACLRSCCGFALFRRCKTCRQRLTVHFFGAFGGASDDSLFERLLRNHTRHAYQHTKRNRIGSDGFACRFQRNPGNGNFDACKIGTASVC